MTAHELSRQAFGLQTKLKPKKWTLAAGQINDLITDLLRIWHPDEDNDIGMKRKTQHNAVNNQEDEDSCTYPICFLGNAPVDKKEDKSVEDSTGHLFNETPGNKDKLTDGLE